MISITLILMLRLIPYAIVARYGARKGYRWLTLFAVYLILVAVLNMTFSFDQTIRGLLSSGGAILLLFHVLDLKPKRPNHEEVIHETSNSK